MKYIYISCLALLSSFSIQADEPAIIHGLSTNGAISVVCDSSHYYWATEWAYTPQGPWMPSEIWNLPVTGSIDTAELPLSDFQTAHAFFRVVSSPDIIVPPQGAAGFTSDTNGWGTVSGQILFWEGNFMPGSPTGTITPVQRTIFFFDLTNVGINNWHSYILSPFRGSANSDIYGYFSIRLPPGDYSVLVLERFRYYSHGWDGAGNISPLHLGSNQNINIQFNIIYLAVW